MVDFPLLPESGSLAEVFIVRRLGKEEVPDAQMSGSAHRWLLYMRVIDLTHEWVDSQTGGTLDSHVEYLVCEWVT